MGTDTKFCITTDDEFRNLRLVSYHLQSNETTKQGRSPFARRYLSAIPQFICVRFDKQKNTRKRKNKKKKKKIKEMTKRRQSSVVERCNKTLWSALSSPRRVCMSLLSNPSIYFSRSLCSFFTHLRVRPISLDHFEN